MINIEFTHALMDEVDVAQLERAALATLNHQGTSPEASLSIIITDDTQLQQLNFQYLKVDAPTDVLSFPAGFTDPDTNTVYLGDILISYPQAQIQAASAGHPVEAELKLLVVHAVLHLLGYDHLEATDKADMWVAQGQILAQLGSPIINPPL